MSNATDFISAYNTVDARMRAMYRGKGSLQFVDLVRRCAEFNSTVKKYEDELLSFAKLRNAIVHESNRERIIAEPCDEVTQLFLHIAEMLSRPPKLGSLKPMNVMGIEGDRPLAEAVVRMSERQYSNLPVYTGGKLVGMLNNRRIVRVVGNALRNGTDVEDTLTMSCRDAVDDADMIKYYKLLTTQNTIQEAVDAFGENRKLFAVLVTGPDGDLANLLTASDLPRLLKLLEE